jgi:metallophosphoesterase (TIGR00282 family)
VNNGLLVVALIGDVIGDPGRKALFLSLSKLIDDKKIDFVIANGENAAGGFGITGKIADDNQRLLRPANYPKGAPGKGWTILEKNGHKLGIMNLLGRVYMEPLENPFRTARKEISIIQKETHNIVVDFHGEATSEKVALGWYLDGKVSGVIGTHTHVQTADERILPGGTAYITDAGMTGPFDSIIGVRKENALKKFVTLIPSKFNVAENDVRMNGVVFSIDPDTGKAKTIERINEKVLD